MADLIDRQALLRKYCKAEAKGDCSKCDWQGDSWCRGEIFGTQIDAFPSVDAVEVPKDNADDMNRAIIGLGMFRLSFCLNVRETDVQGEPVFRCEECPFEDKKTRKCAVKIFLNKNATEEQRHKFLPIV